jgi:hypothetical protein
MRYIILLLLLLPLPASASILLADCDNEDYDIIVRNSGSERVVKLTMRNGEIEEFGPFNTISFQIKNAPGDEKKHPVMHPIGPDEEFCIWSGEIKIQRLEVIGGWHGGGWR